MRSVETTSLPLLTGWGCHPTLVPVILGFDELSLHCRGIDRSFNER
ncbi:hypothetical protein [Sphingobacterium allocomposti]|nr:hypothetical protein [Sphingobacterium composti Yoo et al. 2007 non Ten et al. 2007]HLS94046.1 hypothetical protein [Sphingobacterium sp.]